MAVPFTKMEKKEDGGTALRGELTVVLCVKYEGSCKLLSKLHDTQ